MIARETDDLTRPQKVHCNFIVVDERMTSLIYSSVNYIGVLMWNIIKFDFHKNAESQTAITPIDIWEIDFFRLVQKWTKSVMANGTIDMYHMCSILSKFVGISNWKAIFSMEAAFTIKIVMACLKFILGKTPRTVARSTQRDLV